MQLALARLRGSASVGEVTSEAGLSRRRLIEVFKAEVGSQSPAVGQIQGVWVHPDWRGRGLAKAVTAGMTERLFEAGARDVVLDVRATNLAGQTAYEHIGYRRHITLLAGPGSRR